MSGADGLQFFTGWVSVGILWLLCSTFCVGLFPLWEGRHSMANTFKGIFKDLTGKHGAATGTTIREGSERSISQEAEESEKIPNVVVDANN